MSCNHVVHAASPPPCCACSPPPPAPPPRVVRAASALALSNNLDLRPATAAAASSSSQGGGRAGMNSYPDLDLNVDLIKETDLVRVVGGAIFFVMSCRGAGRLVCMCV